MTAEQAPKRAASSSAATTPAAPPSTKPAKPWARDFDACVLCGKSDSRHQGKGICERCSRAGRRDTTKPQTTPLRGGPAKLSAAKARNVRVLVTGALVAADLGAGRLAPTVWETPDDRLTQEEIASLTVAIYATLESFPKFLEWLAAAASAGVYAQLGMALGMVALPRLMRRGLVPPDVGAAIYFALLTVPPVTAEVGNTVPVAAGPTPEPDWHNGNGQEHASSVPARGAPLSSDFPQQAR